MWLCAINVTDSGVSLLTGAVCINHERSNGVGVKKMLGIEFIG